MWEMDEFTSINKLKTIVKNRFGKGLEISRLTDLNSVKPDSDFFFKKSDMIIPIYHENHFLGSAIIKQAKDVDMEQLYTLYSLVHMTLKPALLSKFENLKHENSEVLEKTISDDVGNYSIKMIQDAASSKGLNLVSLDEKKIVAQVIHLNGVPEIVLKVAHQIHELEKRWGFVPLKDLNVNLQSLDDIQRLGAMTIFIANILDLTSEQQKLIADYQAQGIFPDNPLIIIGSNFELKQIANHPSITSELLLSLDPVTFEVNKAPMTYQKLKEVVEMLFYTHDRY